MTDIMQFLHMFQFYLSSIKSYVPRFIDLKTD